MIWYASLHPWLNLGFVYCVQACHYILGPCYGGDKKPVCSAAHIWSKLWSPGCAVLFGPCPPGTRELWPHCSALGTNLASCQSLLLSAIGVSIPTPPQHCDQNALAPCMAEDHTILLLINWSNPINKSRSCCKNTVLASAMITSVAIVSSALDDRVPPQKTSFVRVQAKAAQTGAMDGFTQMSVRADFGRWCLCTTAAPIICLALSCQPSSNVASCYMELLSGPRHCWWQTRMGGCW